MPHPQRVTLHLLKGPPHPHFQNHSPVPFEIVFQPRQIIDHAAHSSERQYKHERAPRRQGVDLGSGAVELE